MGLHYEAAVSGGTGTLTHTVTVTGPDGWEAVLLELAGDVSVDLDGPYTARIAVTDANGCRASASDRVDVYTPLEVFVSATGWCGDDLHFDFQSDVAGGSGNVVYAWTLYGDGDIVSTTPELGPDTATGSAMATGSGEYYAEATVTDVATGCSATRSASARVWVPLQVTLSAADALTRPTMSSDEITATASVSGGSGAFAITWSGVTAREWTC